ncbi:MAG: WD40 repeat domain-containing protein [Gemmataceae bacterium]
MGTLRLVEASGPCDKHEGEVYSTSYTPDGAYLLSGGWDGYLRLWDTQSGCTITSLSASPKPISACVCSPDGQYWLAGSMEGLLTVWDGVSHSVIASHVAHTRPISGIDFSPTGELLATASWDRQVSLRRVDQLHEGKILGNHTDIIAGCRFSLDGQSLYSWSYDATIKVWDLNLLCERATLTGHTDRITSFTLAPDGRMALTGSRDATIRLWDLEQLTELATVNIGAEVRSCSFLLDGESVIVVDSVGRMFLMVAPIFAVVEHIQTPFKTLSGTLSPNGLQIALGGEDGMVYFLDIEGQDKTPFIVTATPFEKEEPPSMLGRLFGGPRTSRQFSYTCPSCRYVIQVRDLPTQPVGCPCCGRSLRVRNRQPQMA